jgi:ABC-type dipeptide/oligopeptide/nickel transport system ATPase component
MSSNNKCFLCEETFLSEKELKKHYERMPWRNYAKLLKRTHEIKCTLCNERFVDEREFALHWDANHESMIEERKYLFPPSRESEDWTVRPMEEELVKHNLRTDSAYAALKSDFTITEMMDAEINHGVKEDEMTVVEIVGIPGSGKSLFGLTIARVMQTRWVKKIISLYKTKQINKLYIPTVYIGFDVETTLRYLKDAKIGDVIIQDEDPAMMGGHSGSTKQQIENVMKVMRKACVSFIFISPLSTPYINMPNMVFEVIKKNKKKRLTKAALYDRKYHAAGWVIVKILDLDDELLIAYNGMKDENLERIKQSGGRRSVGISEEQVLEDMRKLLNYLKKIKYNFTKRHSLPDLIEYANMAKVEGDSLYQRLIAKQVKEFMEQNISDLLEDDLSDSMDIRGKYLIEKIAEYDDISFLETIYESIDEAMSTIKSRSTKDPRDNPLNLYQPHHAKAWYNYYYHGLSYDSVGSAFGVTGQMIANSYKNGGYNAIFQEEIQGECAEIAIQKRYFRDYKHIGGFGRPDLVLESNPDNDWIEVKCFRRLSEKLSSLISKFEYEFVDSGGTLRLVLITYEQQACKIRIYKVLLNPQYKSVDDIKSELDQEEFEKSPEEDIEEEFDAFELEEDL